MRKFHVNNYAQMHINLRLPTPVPILQVTVQALKLMYNYSVTSPNLYNYLKLKFFREMDLAL